MQTIGLVGGLSWYSTVEYYRVLNEQVQHRLGGHASARVALQSLDFSEVRAAQLAGDWARAGVVLGDAARSCERAGADFVLICSNLMHKVYDDVAAAVSIPVVHIGDAVAARARSAGHTTLGLLGSSWVMEERFYRDRLAQHGIECVVPGPDDRAMVDRVVFDELTQGRFEPLSRDAYLAVIAKLAEQGAESVVLACTEIEQLVPAASSAVPLLDSMRAHAEHAVDLALGADEAVSLSAR